jgi:cyclophilin family peptidyl-prolyl cis-trans isomerase
MRMAVRFPLVAFAMVLMLAFGMAKAWAESEAAEESAAPDPENILYMEITHGVVTIELLPDLAPRHVARIKQLTREGFYDGVIFHRVIEGFMAQTGDPTGTGLGGSDLPDLRAEFSNVPHTRGILSMARSESRHSANSQFFIMFEDGPRPGMPWRQLDGQYTVWGRVVDGMELVDRIARGEPPAEPDRIVRMRVAADVPGPDRLDAYTPRRRAAPRQPDPDDILAPVLRRR